MDKPEKRKLSKEPLAYLQYDKGYNHCHAEWEAYILERLEKMKLPEFTLKTSDVFNKRIDRLIGEIR